MAFEFTIPHAFSVVSVRAHAPAAGGVYGISNSQEWILIGETDNIRERLLQHLNRARHRNQSTRTDGLHLRTLRIYGEDGTAQPAGHTNRLVTQYDPVCNRELRGARKRKA